MIIRSLLRRPSALQSLPKAPAKRFFSAAPVRLVHNRPSLQNHDDLVRNGIPGLFSKEAFKLAYLDYQQLMVDELNACTAGTEAENKSVKDLVIGWARDPQKAYEFNVASMAHNNHLFFSGINSDPNVVSSPSTDLTYAIHENFSSLDSLRREFIATANAMFGPGFVWLVQENDGPRGHSSGNLKILATYLAGSPLSGAHYRRQQHDLNTHNPDSFQHLNHAGSFGKTSANQPDKQKPYGGVDISPLLCVDTWEHVWLTDYGIRGKEAFLEAWWDKIDWNVVEGKARLMPANKGIKGANQFR